MMSVVVFTGPNGNRIAINSAAWQTVIEDIGGAKGARTQIGFSGATSAIHVKESCDEVILRLQEAEAAQAHSKLLRGVRESEKSPPPADHVALRSPAIAERPGDQEVRHRGD